MYKWIKTINLEPCKHHTLLTISSIQTHNTFWKFYTIHHLRLGKLSSRFNKLAKTRQKHANPCLYEKEICTPIFTKDNRYPRDLYICSKATDPSKKMISVRLHTRFLESIHQFRVKVLEPFLGRKQKIHMNIRFQVAALAKQQKLLSIIVWVWLWPKAQKYLLERKSRVTKASQKHQGKTTFRNISTDQFGTGCLAN